MGMKIDETGHYLHAPIGVKILKMSADQNRALLVKLKKIGHGEPALIDILLWSIAHSISRSGYAAEENEDILYTIEDSLRGKIQALTEEDA